jgi:hypothetical protein
MDSLITAAARALSAGDPLAALNFVALRSDAPALALRGIAMAQLGDFALSKTLLRQAARRFGDSEPVACARCIVAEAEVALASRDLAAAPKGLDAALFTLEKRGDRVNAAHARHIQSRLLLLTGRLDEAERVLGRIDPGRLPPAWRAAHELAVAGIAMRRIQPRAARAALARAGAAARKAGIAALRAEVESASQVLGSPVARQRVDGREKHLTLEDVEALLDSGAVVVDACRYVVRDRDTVFALARRPVLFTLARALGEAWPGEAPRATLIRRTFRGKHVDDSYRARLRVEIGRLRSALRPLAGVRATKAGYVLAPHGARKVVVLAPPVEEPHAAVLALLADGEPWSTSALALALSESQRTVQRALESLAAAGKVAAIGHGRARKWVSPPLPGFTTTLLLPAPLPTD